MSNPTELPDLDAERLLFEADTAETFAAATFGRFPVGGNYNVTWVQEQWNGWQRAIRARRAQPEGEAPQAERADERTDFEAAMIARGYQQEMFDGFYAEGEHAYYDKMANCMFSAWRAALAAQSQGAQAAAGAERGTDYIMAAVASYADDRSAGTLERIRRMVAEGEQARAAQQAAAPGFLNYLRDGYASGFFASGPDDGDHRFTLHYDTAEQAEAAFMAITSAIESSAPGTPEAPKSLDLSRITSVVLQDRGSKSVIVRFGQSMAAATKFLDQFGTLVLTQRAAQLDGGQGEGAGHVD